MAGIQLATASCRKGHASWHMDAGLQGRGGEPMTIRFILEDYVSHIMHHLRNIGMQAKDLGSASQSAWSVDRRSRRALKCREPSNC